MTNTGELLADLRTELMALEQVVHNASVSGEAIGMRIRNTWDMYRQVLNSDLLRPSSSSDVGGRSDMAMLAEWLCDEFECETGSFHDARDAIKEKWRSLAAALRQSTPSPNEQKLGSSEPLGPLYDGTTMDNQQLHGTTRRNQPVVTAGETVATPSTGQRDEREATFGEDGYNPAYDEGITYAIRMLADLTGSKDWQMKDGSEDHESDVRDTIMDVLKYAGLYDDEDGKFATLASPGQQDELEAIAPILENLDELDKQRTPGPWKKTHDNITVPRTRNLVARCDANWSGFEVDIAKASKNARFIVALENAWPKIRALLSRSPAPGGAAAMQEALEPFAKVVFSDDSWEAHDLVTLDTSKVRFKEAGLTVGHFWKARDVIAALAAVEQASGDGVERTAVIEECAGEIECTDWSIPLKNIPEFDEYGKQIALRILEQAARQVRALLAHPEQESAPASVEKQEGATHG